MSDINATARVDLEVNGKRAENELNRLKQQALDYRDAMAQAAKSGDNVSYEKWRRELKRVEKEIKNVQSATRSVEDVMRRLDSATPKQLKDTLKTLERQLQGIERGSEAWNEHTAKIRRVKEAIGQMNSELRVSETKMQKLKRLFNEWQGIAVGVIGVVTGLILSGKKAVSVYAEMEQEMANVRKFTGMTADEVDDLNAAFKGIDTRTSREDLNKLAQEAGRLGKQSLDDVLGFVRAADKINVALDDLGDGATLQLSKLTQIFGDEQRLGTEKALLSVGSVINELSQNCAASAPYLANFASRLGGVGAQAGMTVQQIMGIAAVLDSKGQKVEASATAIAQVITRMYQDPAKYAKAAGLDIEYFTELVRKDANEALMVLSETLNAKGGLKETAPIFKDMGENGSRAVAALATLAENIKEVRAQQEVANQAFNEAVSIDQEFAVQNGTVQAGLDKAKKSLNEIAVELGQKLMPIMGYFMSSSTMTLKLLSKTVDFIVRYKAVLIELGVAIAAYSIAVNMATIKTKLFAAAQALSSAATKAMTIAQQGWAVVCALCSGNMRRLTQEVKLFSAMLKTTPFGLAVAGLSAIVIGATALHKKLNELNRAQRDIADAEREAAREANRQMAETERLYKKTQELNASTDERIKAAERLREMHPTTIGQLSAEEILAGKAAGTYKNLAESIRDVARAKAYEKKLEANYDSIADLETKQDDLVERLRNMKGLPAHVQFLLTGSLPQNEIINGLLDYKERTKAEAHTGTANYATPGAMAQSSNARTRIDGILNSLAKNNKQIAKIEDANEKLSKRIKKHNDEASANADTDDGNGDSPEINPVNGNANATIKDRFAEEKNWRTEQEAYNRIAYAVGEKNYLEYTQTMDQIAVDYFKKLLNRTDLSNLERLGFEADYAEASKKLTDQQVAESIKAENNRYAAELANAKQCYIDGEYAKSTYDEAIERLEIEHQSRLVEIYAEGSAERASAESKLQDLLMRQTEKKQREREAKEKEFAKDYEKMQNEYFGDSPSVQKSKYDADLEMLTEIYDAERAAAEDSYEDLLFLEEQFEKAKLALKKKYNQDGTEDDRNAMQRAIGDSLEWLNGEGGKALTGTMSTLVSSMSSIFSQLSSIIQSELEMQTAAINKKYEDELSAAEGNSYKIAKLEKQKVAEIAKAKKEANRKMFAMQVIQAVAQTAQGAISAYASAAAIPIVGFVMAPLAAAAALAAGALQISAIKKQQQASESQGYAKGGFTRPGAVGEPAGIVHAGEWVASQRLVNSPNTRPVINALEHAQRTNTIGSFRSAGYAVEGMPAQQIAQSQVADTALYSITAISELNNVVARLNDRLDEPFVTVNTVTGDQGIKKAQDEFQRLMRNKSPKSKK